MRPLRLGRQRTDVVDGGSQLTNTVIERILDVLQQHWDATAWDWPRQLRKPRERPGLFTRQVRPAGPATLLVPTITNGPPMKIIDRPGELNKRWVGDTGIEPVTSSV